MDKRMSGNQIVVMVALICLAGVLAPVGVYAASVQQVRLVDAKSARAVKVDSKGRLTTTTSGTVGISGKVGVSGTVGVGGTVSARPSPPTQPFHREAALGAATNVVVGAPIPQGANLAITSVQVMYTDGSGWSQLTVRKAEANGTCTGTGALLLTVTNLRMASTNPNEQVTFAVPSIQTAVDRPLCLVLASAIGGQAVIDGYLY